MATSIAHTAILCELPPEEGLVRRIKNLPSIPRLRSSATLPPEGGKIILQPRLCTLRSYGSGSIRSPAKSSGTDTSFFFSSLADYVDSARKSHDFEILSGRVAMECFDLLISRKKKKKCSSSIFYLRSHPVAFFQIAFAAAVGVEFVTGNSLFKKLDLKEIAGATGVCLVVVSSAAIFAWFSSARARISQILTLSCNSFVDSLVDNIIDGLFYENELSDWSDET